AGLSARPATDSSAPLAPIEPRFQVLVGIAYTLFDWERSAAEPVVSPAQLSAPAPALVVAPAPVAARAPAPAASLLVHVTTADGYPLSDAVVELQVGPSSLTVPHQNLESYLLADPPSGEATLRVSAPRLSPQTRPLRLAS